MSFEEIYEMQRQLNTRTVGQPVDEKMSEEDRLRWMLNYNLAQAQEQAELTDSLDWKWWKKGENDWQNIRIELVDELHFWMSKCQIAGLSAQDIIDLYKKKNALNWKRQEEGYKEGRYEKVVDGREDNEALHETRGATAKIKAAVVTGHHPFDVPAFHAAFRSFPDVDFYPQHMEDFSVSAGGARDQYDVVVFYNMHTETPTGEGPWYEKSAQSALESLGESEQGILVLHHAILAYPEWDFWRDLVGIEDRSFSYHMDQQLHVEVANQDHPITARLSGFDLTDETYKMASPGEDSEALLTTAHEQSMKTLAWTRQFRNARVFCYQCGHDNAAFANHGFRTVLHRGLQWLAGRI